MFLNKKIFLNLENMVIFLNLENMVHIGKAKSNEKAEKSGKRRLKRKLRRNKKGLRNVL